MKMLRTLLVFAGLAMALAIGQPALAADPMTQKEVDVILEGLSARAAGDETGLLRALASGNVSLERMSELVSEMAVLAPVLRYREIRAALKPDADPAVVKSVSETLSAYEAGANEYYSGLENGARRRGAAEPLVSANLEKVETLLLPTLQEAGRTEPEGGADGGGR